MEGRRRASYPPSSPSVGQPSSSRVMAPASVTPLRFGSASPCPHSFPYSISSSSPSPCPRAASRPATPPPPLAFMQQMAAAAAVTASPARSETARPQAPPPWDEIGPEAEADGRTSGGDGGTHGGGLTAGLTGGAPSPGASADGKGPLVVCSFASPASGSEAGGGDGDGGRVVASCPAAGERQKRNGAGPQITVNLASEGGGFAAEGGMDLLLEAAAAEAHGWGFGGSALGRGDGGSSTTAAGATATAAHGWTAINSPPPSPSGAVPAATTISVVIPQFSEQSPVDDVFNIPAILDTTSFGAVLASQRTLIDCDLGRLAMLPLRSAQGAVLTAGLRRHLLVHAETLDRAAALSRHVSIPGSLSERFRRDAVAHDWSSFCERRRRFEDLIKIRSEAEWVWHSWSGFDRGDLVGPQVEEEEEEEEGEEDGNDEAAVGLAEWAKEWVEMEVLEWMPDAVDTLVVVAEGWAARWFFLKQETASREVKRQHVEGGGDGGSSPKRPRRSPRKTKAKVAEKTDEGVMAGWFPEGW